MKTLSDAFNTSGGGSFDWIGAVRWWGQQLGMVLSYLIPVIVPMIGAIAYCAPQIVKLGQYIWIAGTYVVAFGQALYGAGLWIYNLPGRIWSAIMSGVNSFVSAFWSAANWIWNLPGNLWSLISSRIPTLRWPTAGEILGAIKGALGISGPGYNVRSMYNEAKAQQVASSLQRQAATNTPSASTSKFISAYNAYKSPFAFGPGNDFTPSYKRYAGHQTNNVWNEDGSCLTGNCVDMTYGMINRYGGGAAIGNWNGGLHMWYVSPNGEQLDPSRKALEGTWSPPAQGPSSTNAPIIIPVSIGGKKVAEFIVDTVTNEVFDAGRF
jgi:hypothetical protein